MSTPQGVGPIALSVAAPVSCCLGANGSGVDVGMSRCSWSLFVLCTEYRDLMFSISVIGQQIRES